MTATTDQYATQPTPVAGAGSVAAPRDAVSADGALVEQVAAHSGPTGSAFPTPPMESPVTPVEAGIAVLATGAGAIASHPHSRAFMDRVEAFIARMTVKSGMWRWLSSRIWLPIAFRSGIRFKKVDANTFHAVLPFKRFNRNWYNAMAGASLLANSEIAGGMYLWGRVGGDYTVVCKNLTYKFLRPCFGPALYRVKPRQDLDALVAKGGEFNIDIDLEVVQQIVPGKHAAERRVGVSQAVFHVTPKRHHKSKAERKRQARQRRAGE